MSRQSRQESDRIGVRQCSWKYHGEFIEDLKRVQVDRATWASIKAMMNRAADGTARDVDWEYPMASSSGTIGELRHVEQGEVTYVDSGNKLVTEPAEVHYRVYFNEPTLCPAELWAMAGGAKSLHPEFVGSDQQNDIDIAGMRASQTNPTGSELHNFTT